MDQNKKNEKTKEKKKDLLNEIIDKSKSFEEQIKWLEEKKIQKSIGL